jgi:hypothetical protein
MPRMKLTITSMTTPIRINAAATSHGKMNGQTAINTPKTMKAIPGNIIIRPENGFSIMLRQVSAIGHIGIRAACAIIYSCGQCVLGCDSLVDGPFKTIFLFEDRDDLIGDLQTAFRSFSGTSSIKKMSVYFLYKGKGMDHPVVVQDPSVTFQKATMTAASRKRVELNQLFPNFDLAQYAAPGAARVQRPRKPLGPFFVHVRCWLFSDLM